MSNPVQLRLVVEAPTTSRSLTMIRDQVFGACFENFPLNPFFAALSFGMQRVPCRVRPPAAENTER
jgi:hypothetical protein